MNNHPLVPSTEVSGGELLAGIVDTLGTTLSLEKETTDSILAHIQNIAETNYTDEEKQKKLKKFIEKRIHFLNPTTNTHEQKQIDLPFNNKINSFIFPTTVIKRSMLVDGFTINDDGIYTILCENIIKLYIHWNKQPIRTVFLDGIIYSLGQYFGNHASGKDINIKNQSFYRDHPGNDQDSIDLQEMKEQGFAVCIEKASVAHNYFHFLGIDSHLILSSNCVLGGSSTDAHAYIVFSTEKGFFLFDPTNSKKTTNKDTSKTHYTPSIYPLTQKDFQGLLGSEKYTVNLQYTNQSIENNQYIQEESISVIYGS